MHISLEGQNILVTGASRGIGAAIADAMELSGAQLIKHASKVHEGKDFLVADLERKVEVERLWPEILKRCTKVHTIVFNAGVYLPQPIDMPLADWQKVWDKSIQINLNSIGYMLPSVLSHMKETGGGRLIFIGSRAATSGETEEYLGYAASKGALISLTKTIARSYGKFGIKSFYLAPGFVATEMAAQALENSNILQEIALDRITKPEDIAPLTVFIASGKMDHATGTTIDINAGSYMR